MRNKLLVLAIVMCSFFAFKGKASAISNEITTSSAIDYYSDVFKERFESELSSSNLNLDKVDNKLKEDYELLKNTYPYYMTIVNCNDSNSCNMHVYYFKIKPNIKFVAYKNSDNNFVYGYANNSNDNIDVFYKTFYFGKGYPSSSTSFNNFITLNLTSNTFAKNEWISYHFHGSSSYSVKYNNKHYTFLYPAQILYDANFDIVRRNSSNSNYTNYDVKMGDSYYQHDDFISTYKEILKPKTPQISTTIENTLLDDDNDVLQKKIVINWSVKNQSKYKYMFKTSFEDNWKYFFTEDLTDEILVNKNGSYIFQVADLNDNYITGTAVTITGIKEQLPTLKLSDYTGVGCYYNNQQICAILTLYSDNADFSKYTLQYRFNTGEWITHNYENSAKGQIQIYENTTLTARLIRNIDNKLIDSASYTITKINPNVVTDVPKFKFDRTFCTNLSPDEWHEIGHGNYKQTLKMTIYGLDMTKYRVFISDGDAHNFKEVTQFEYEDRVPLVKYYYFEYYTDTYFVVKITDLNGNYVTGTSYTLHFTCNDVNLELGDFEDMNDVFKAVTNFFDKMKNIMMKIKEVIEYFYNSLNSEIKAFILTAFILIIVLNLIMRMMK